jgi:excisionase family DNA binding protein
VSVPEPPPSSPPTAASVTLATPEWKDASVGAMSVQLYRVSEAMRILGLSRSAIYRQFQSGRLRSVHQGRTRLVPVTAIADYVALLESEAASQVAP